MRRLIKNFDKLYKNIKYLRNLCFFSLAIIYSSMAVFAYEDYLIIADGKLTDISIEDNSIVNVYPLVTLMNDKNTLLISPLNTGKTRVCVLKNNKDIVMFNIEITQNKTLIDEVKGFDILSLDTLYQDWELDKPPMLGGQ